MPGTEISPGQYGITLEMALDYTVHFSCLSYLNTTVILLTESINLFEFLNDHSLMEDRERLQPFCETKILLN